MSKEMLPRKLSEDLGFDPETPIVTEETKKERRRGLALVLLIGVGVAILALIGTALVPYVNSLGGNIFDSMSSTSDSDNSVVKATTALAASFEAIDGKGNMIENDNGVARSDQITISGYSHSGYSTKLHCSIDSLPIYCNGSTVTVSGLPPGKHTFTIVEPSSGETIVRTFSWENVSP
jgi:hypothetical protein